MEGITLSQRRAPQVLRCFAPTRLAEDLLGGVYERLLAITGSDAADQSPIMEWELPESPIRREHLLTTGGR